MQGLGTVLGFGEETTWGTTVAPTKFIEITEESLDLKQIVKARTSLRSATPREPLKGKRGVEGSFKFNLCYEGAELLLKHLMGSVSTAVVGSLKQHSFLLAEALPTGLSLNLQRGEYSQDFRYGGCKVSKLTLTQNLEGFLEASIDIVGQEETLVTHVTPTLPSAPFVMWDEFTGTFDSIAWPAQMIELTIENPLANDSYKLGNRLRQRLERGGVRKISGKVEMEFENISHYNYFRNQTQIGHTFTWTGPTVSGANYVLGVTGTKIVFQEAPMGVKSVGPIKIAMPFESFASASNNETLIQLTNTVVSV